MKTITLLFLSFITLSFTGAAPLFKASVIVNKQNIAIIPDAIIKLNGAKNFELQFKMPKQKESMVRIYASRDNVVYNQFKSGVSIDNIEIFKGYNTFAVSVKEYTKLDQDFYVSNSGVRAFVHESSTFTSFTKVDSTQQEYTFTHPVKEIFYIDHDKDIRKNYSLGNFEADTIYCILTASSTGTAMDTTFAPIPFKMVLK
ncbi:MAG: hypothetical protein ACKOXB_05865 [Flavobacteriales bacterium]